MTHATQTVPASAPAANDVPPPHDIHKLAMAWFLESSILVQQSMDKDQTSLAQDTAMSLSNILDTDSKDDQTQLDADQKLIQGYFNSHPVTDGQTQDDPGKLALQATYNTDKLSFQRQLASEQSDLTQVSNTIKGISSDTSAASTNDQTMLDMAATNLIILLQGS
jgi:CII-binding regulator of phage lambda lysogenization HflD